jgi:hypothetical protein
MTQEQFERERRYCIMMTIIREMVSAGLLLPKEIRHLETIIAKKYLPVMGPLFA